MLYIRTNYSCWANLGKCQQYIVSANWGVHALQQIWNPALWMGEVKHVLEDGGIMSLVAMEEA